MSDSFHGAPHSARPPQVSDSSSTPEEQRFVAAIRQRLDQGCNALDGQTLARLNRIRRIALERKLERQSGPARMLWPFGGLVTACALVIAVLNFVPGSAETDALAAPLEDIDILASADSLDLYEDYEFYQWLAEN